MALSVAAPTAGVLPILGAVVIGTLDSSGNFVQYASVSYKAPVRVATTVAGTLATSFANGQTVDGIVLATGDRILIKNQVAAADNGIYVVAASGAPTRASDFDSWTEIPGSVVGVLIGTANADTAWLCTSDTGGTLGSTAINFTQFGAGVVYPITPQLGGTGVANNAASTLTISGNFGTTFTVTGATALTLPTSGILVTTTTINNGTLPMSGTTVAATQLVVTDSALVLRGATSTTTGIAITANTVQFIAANTQCVIVSATNVYSNVPFFAPAGSAGSPAFGYNADGSGMYFESNVVVLASGVNEKIRITVAGVIVKSGALFQVGNNAATGLVAGALAALTTASIVIYDATGTAYRVPCLTP